MFPILVQLGPFTIYSLWVCAAIGFFAAFLVVYKLLQKDRARLNFLADHSLAIFFGAVLAARIVFVAENYKSYFAQLDFEHLIGILYIWDKGLSFWGGMIGLCLTLAFFCRKEKEKLWKWLDVLTIGTMAGLVFGNLGTFLDGSNYGNETDLPWGVIMDNSRFAVPIHPTQIYALIYTLCITIVLWNLWNTNYGKQEGNIALTGIICYGIFRFLEEFLRGDESNYLFGLREAQIYCIIALIAAGTLMYLRNKKLKNHPPVQ
jgi:phosphatidylglycerol:prolipoprotein diacylglycerol transferase